MPASRKSLLALVLAALALLPACRSLPFASGGSRSTRAHVEREIPVEPGVTPVFLSGLSVDALGRIGLVTGHGLEGGYRAVVLGPDAPLWQSPPVLQISADDAVLQVGSILLAGQADPHEPGSSLVRLETTRPGSPIAAPPIVLGGKRAFRARLAVEGNALAMTAIPVDREVAESSNARVSVSAAGLANEFEVLGARECESLDFTDDAQSLLVGCVSRAGEPMLLLLGPGATTRTLTGGLGQPAGSHAKIAAVYAHHGFSAVLCGDPGAGCALYSVALDAPPANPIPLPGVASVDQMRKLPDGRVLLAARNGLLAVVERGRARVLMPGKPEGEAPNPRPAISPDGSHVVYGRHGLDADAKLVLVRVEP